MAVRSPRALPLVLLVLAGWTGSSTAEGPSARRAPTSKPASVLEGTVWVPTPGQWRARS